MKGTDAAVRSQGTVFSRIGTRMPTMFSNHKRRTIMYRYLAELVGTFVLGIAGCRSAVLAGNQIGFPGVSLAFGRPRLDRHPLSSSSSLGP